MKKPPAAALNGKNTRWSTRMTHGMTGWEASRLNTKRKRMYPHQCRICGKTYYNSRDSKSQGTCCKRCSMIYANISRRLKRHPLRDAAALMKHLQLMLKTIDQKMCDRHQMIDLMSSYEWDVLIELCERDWPFLEGCSEEELDALAQLVDVAEDLLDLPAQMPPTKMPRDVYREFLDVLY